jgi:hypothetical protein
VSDLTRIVSDLAGDAFPGLSPRLRFERLPDRCVAILEDQLRNPLALGAGPDHGAACQMLIRQLVSGEYTLTAEDVAAILGVSQSAIRQRRWRGQATALTPVEAGSGPRGHRFAVADVARLLTAPAPAAPSADSPDADARPH